VNARPARPNRRGLAHRTGPARQVLRCYPLAMSSTRSTASDVAPQTVTELEHARADARRQLRDAVDDVRNQAKKAVAAKLTDEEIEAEIRKARAERHAKL
jgi:hypothetical protein